MELPWCQLVTWLPDFGCQIELSLREEWEVNELLHIEIFVIKANDCLQDYVNKYFKEIGEKNRLIIMCPCRKSIKLLARKMNISNLSVSTLIFGKVTPMGNG